MIRLKLPQNNWKEDVATRRAKIVATVGPACNTEAAFRELVRAGLDVARLNFSHGTQQEKTRLIQMIRKVAREEGKPLCIMGDLQGPKIRTGKLKNHAPVLLKTGQKLTITPRDIAGTSTLISTTFPTLAENLETGARILLSDGLIELRVRGIYGVDVECEVVNGGMLGEHKGINLPGIHVRVPSLTAKDEGDLEFAIQQNLDAIAVSFVRNAEDVRLTKYRIAALGADMWVIAKLEKPQAIEHLEAILEIADGVMVARGDLGVEMPPEKVPALQKLVIRRAAEYRKPVITATQMLESMIENPRPTRAEASDVANAIYDGTDAVMLSAETATGKYPVEAVSMMARIVTESEQQITLDRVPRTRSNKAKLSVAETICESMAHAAEEVDVSAIAVFTETGSTARMLSKYKPQPPIFALSSVEAVINRTNLLWGVRPILCKKMNTTDLMVVTAEHMLEEQRYVLAGQIVGIVAGTRTKTGSTNFMRLHTVGDTDVPDKVRRKAARQFAEIVTSTARSASRNTAKSPATKKAAKATARKTTNR